MDSEMHWAAMVFAIDFTIENLVQKLAPFDISTIKIHETSENNISDWIIREAEGGLPFH